MARDEFTDATIRLCGDRVGWRCSNPSCAVPTKGANSHDKKATNVGSASHIHAASPGGARYSPSQTPDERKAIDNAIWLCRTCGTLVDADEQAFPASLLRAWRAQSELRAFESLGKVADKQEPQLTVVSINQSGGQTAHTIHNHALPPRTLMGRTVPAATRERLVATPVRALAIHAWNPDAETLEFAHHFWELANQLGWELKSLPDHCMSPEPFKGIKIFSARSGDADDPLRALADWLTSEGFRPEFVAAQVQSAIRVGARP